ncbi:MAG: ERCC4 domain-containing protein [Candidatus Hadarchaeota archaeon]
MQAVLEDAPLEALNTTDASLGGNMGKQKLRVIADHREVPSGVVEELRKMGVEVEERQLGVGDFILSQRVGVERKSAGDFLQSMIDGRLLTQAKLLRESFERPVLMVEGKDLYKRRAIHPNAIRGALAALAIDLGIPLIPTANAKDTAHLLAAIARREQAMEFNEAAMRRKVCGLDMHECQRFVVEGLPGVSAVLAKRLLEHFKTVEAVMRASEEELREVHGIGKVKAKRIRELLAAFYEDKAEEATS